jgi:hypothetical protein
MPGIVYRISPRIQLTGGVTPSISVTLAKGVDISTKREATLLVRVHKNNLSPSGTTISIALYAEAPAPDDPGLDFFIATALAQVTINNATGALPILLSSAASFGGFATNFGNLGTHVRVVAIVTGGGSGESATFSVDLSVKD